MAQPKEIIEKLSLIDAISNSLSKITKLPKKAINIRNGV